MPATEKTWRDQKIMHVVFGCTGLLLLVSTVWMFGADHSREWKDYQRKNRRITTSLTKWGMAASKSADNVQQREDLQAQLDEELRSPVDPASLEDFLGIYEADEDEESELRELNARIDKSEDPDERAELRIELTGKLASVVRAAKFIEDNASRKRKFKNADYDESKAIRDIGVRDELPSDTLVDLQAGVEGVKSVRQEITYEAQDAAKYRINLQNKLRDMQSNEAAILKQITDNESQFNQLATTLDDRKASYLEWWGIVPLPGKRLLELPIADAFNSPLKIDNLWTQNLTITNGSFGQVTRFDRCTTCHQNIDKTAPGSAVNPLFEKRHEVTLELALPESRPKDEVDDEGNVVSEPTLASVIGIDLALEGLVDPNEVTVKQITPKSIAALAPVVATEGHLELESLGFQVGDVIAFIGPDEVNSPSDVEQMLLRDAEWGGKVKIRVNRGLPHPFNSHPRLDLFVGSLSPHKLSVFGCSICHEGQGSATEFKWVSHSPNTPAQGEQWSKEYGWFDNHHWIYPMNPERFAESSCLKCHHNVVELDKSERFPDAPAPKVVHGYNLIRKYGCYGCHEINGYNGPDRIGPDLRLEPNYFAAAAQIKADPNYKQLPSEQRDWVEQLIQHPERTGVRHQLLDFLAQDAGKTTNSAATQSDAAESDEQAVATLSADSHRMAEVLADVDSPGELRRSGPSLRYVAKKLGKAFLVDWVRDPKNFRPTTRMPKFFGHWDHLQDEPEALQRSKDWEPIEILSIVEYLLDRSQELELDQVDDQVATAWDADAVVRGKLAFETRGCLACHQHADFPGGIGEQGPNLSNIGDKFSLPDTPEVQQWMYTWLKSPNKYHSRTVMPDLYLNVKTAKDGTKTDPAADIAAYLLQSKTGWKPAAENQLTPNPEFLKAVVLEHLRSKVFEKDAKAIVESGILPTDIASGLKGAEVELTLGEQVETQDANGNSVTGFKISEKQMLMYVGAKTITKFGCYGCHDIPGFENGKPIGAALAEWGRKDPSKLAFEHIAEYLHKGHGHGSHAGHDDDHESSSHPDDHEPNGAAHAESHEGDHTDSDSGTFDESYYMERIGHHGREGFIWQKLKEPRSYDYQKTTNKDYYNDRLRMPLFPFNDEEREAVITFVLGLVAEPPASEFVYQPNQKQAAMIAGKKAIEKYNCAGCHIIDAEKWEIALQSGDLDLPTQDAKTTFPFMMDRASTAELSASQMEDKVTGLIKAHLIGMPALNDAGIVDEYFDDGSPITAEELETDDEIDPDFVSQRIDLWQPTVIEGQTVGLRQTALDIWIKNIKKKYKANGGDLALLLLPRVTELEGNKTGKNAWGWLPPPLVGEGLKVQTDWLHEFLLNPHVIRPATYMRMPKFNMSPQEATDIANYFAARDNASYPYDYNPRTESTRLADLQLEYEKSLETAEGPKPEGDNRLAHAMGIVTNGTYCVKCHIVGDYTPEGPLQAQAPDLAQIQNRLRPEYLRKWIANPPQILPYTPMPQNIPYDATKDHLGGISQNLYHGTSIEQVDALVDLLMNYSTYTAGKTKIADMVKPAAPNAESLSSGTTE